MLLNLLSVHPNRLKAIDCFYEMGLEGRNTEAENEAEAGVFLSAVVVYSSIISGIQSFYIVLRMHSFSK